MKEEKMKVHFAVGEDALCNEFICGGNWHVGDLPADYEYNGADAEEILEETECWNAKYDAPVQHTCISEFVTCEKCKSILSGEKHPNRLKKIREKGY
jgi:hypothetical protein